MPRIFFLLILSALLFSCDNSTPEFYYTKGDLKYKYHDIVEDGKVPAIGDYLTVYISYETQGGKVIYNSVGSTYDDTQVIHLGKPKIEGGIEEGFAQLMEGDSVTFYIDADKFFTHYLNKEIPVGIDSDEEIEITLRLLRIETPNQYNNRVDEEEELCEIKEFKTIDSIAQSWQTIGDSVQEVGGIYLVKGKEISMDTIKYGSIVKVNYKGYYPNGKEFYNNQLTDPDEFKVGIDGQTIEGLKIALLHLNFGQSAKVIVPSFLGFSNKALEAGQVPKCTPLIFDLQLLPKNENQ